MIYSNSKLDAEKEPIQVLGASCPFTQAWRVHLYNYKPVTCATVQLRLKSGLLMTNQIQEFWYSYDYTINNIVYVVSWNKIQVKMDTTKLNFLRLLIFIKILLLLFIRVMRQEGIWELNYNLGSLLLTWILFEVIYEMFHILNCGFEIK